MPIVCRGFKGKLDLKIPKREQKERYTYRSILMAETLTMRDITYYSYLIHLFFSFSIFDQDEAIRKVAVNEGVKRGILGELEFMNMLARRMQHQRRIGHGLNISSM